MTLPPLLIEDYYYELPDDRIAQFPVTERDKSKLLVYENKEIKHRTFSDLTSILPKNSLLIFNNTRVIKARFHFKNITGANIEIVLLKPAQPLIVEEALACRSNTIWECTIGNLKRWKDGITLIQNISDISLSATLINRANGLVEFHWTPKTLTFNQIVFKFGKIPIPPYLKREVVASDEQAYQTIYSDVEGAVAAPTAGLHFTESLLQRLKSNGISIDYLTLHISAGTFAPIKVSDARKHIMHQEQVVISRTNLLCLLSQKGKVIAVGTTALRTLESLYWYGAMILKDPNADFIVNQFEPYTYKWVPPTARQSLEAVIEYMDRRGKETLIGETSIFIFPEYKFRICKGLITNFHQPRSTLLLLIAAFIGNDWKNVYSQALHNGYQFLSYGDSSILLPEFD